MKKILFLLVVAMLIPVMATAGEIREERIKKEENITWIGHPMISDNDEYTPSQGWLPGYLIGFREDGVVVWEEIIEEWEEVIP